MREAGVDPVLEGEKRRVLRVYKLRLRNKHVRDVGPAVDVDLGLKDLAGLAPAEKITEPRLVRASKKVLATARRARKGKRARAIHRKVANRRKGFLRKVSDRRTKAFSTIVGDVEAKKPARSRMAKGVLDAGWTGLKGMLSYNAMTRGGVSLDVSEAHATEPCPECGSMSASRTGGITHLGGWRCDDCGVLHDRDLEAQATFSASDGTRLLKEPDMTDSAGKEPLSSRRGAVMSGFLDLLRTQRWDDHRYYHHSVVNQSLHLLSAVSFVCAYIVMFSDPALAALLAWLVSMTSRQIGHLIFEPKTYDIVNNASHEYKEAIKIGYNLRRKIVLMSVWALSPLLFVIDPTAFGLCRPAQNVVGFARHVGHLWLAIGIGALLFRTLQLFIIKDVQTGLVWATKIITDPFNDIRLYCGAPKALLRRLGHAEPEDEFSVH